MGSTELAKVTLALLLLGSLALASFQQQGAQRDFASVTELQAQAGAFARRLNADSTGYTAAKIGGWTVYSSGINQWTVQDISDTVAVLRCQYSAGTAVVRISRNGVTYQEGLPQ